MELGENHMTVNVLSKSRPISCGVPQGSTLGPLLFLLYVNDFPNCLEHTFPGMYADDTQITAVSDTVQELENLFNCDVDNLKNWLDAKKC